MYADVGDDLAIHVHNADPGGDCHRLHPHALEYGIDADGAWSLGISSPDGQRSFQILPGIGPTGFVSCRPALRPFQRLR